MSTTKTFECQNCDTVGKIIVKSEDISVSEIVYCPVCAADIYTDEDDE
jgi:hypothetical protein